MSEQVGVGVAEAVDALLLVADYKVFVAVREAFHQQRPQIVPLHTRCVLHLVDEEVAQIVAEALVDERGLVVVDDVAEQGIGVGQEYYVVVFAEISYMPEQASEKSQRGDCADKHSVALFEPEEINGCRTQRGNREVKLLRDTFFDICRAETFGRIVDGIGHGGCGLGHVACGPLLHP